MTIMPYIIAQTPGFESVPAYIRSTLAPYFLFSPHLLCFASGIAYDLASIL